MAFAIPSSHWCSQDNGLRARDADQVWSCKLWPSHSHRMQFVDKGYYPIFFFGHSASTWKVHKKSFEIDSDMGNVFAPNEILVFATRQMSWRMADEVLNCILGKWKLVAAWSCQNASDRTCIPRNEIRTSFGRFSEEDVRQSVTSVCSAIEGGGAAEAKRKGGRGKLGGKVGGQATTGSRAYTSLARKDVLINCNFPWPLLVLVTSMKSHEHTHSEINRTRESDREGGAAGRQEARTRLDAGKVPANFVGCSWHPVN